MPKAVQYTKGSIIFFSGDRDDRIFILQAGVVILTTTDLKSGNTVAEQVHVGEFFGVKNSLAHMPRMETAAAATDCQVVSLTVPEFEKIFAGNKDVTLKMLRVFSKTLRELHKQTEIIMQKDPSVVLPDEGMLAVAQSFYDAEEYHSCMDILKKLLASYPDTNLKNEIVKMLNSAQSCEGRNARRGGSAAAAAAPSAASASALKQFALPMFERFSKTYTNGDVIISEYEPGNTFYLVQSGDVQVVKCIKNSKKNIDIIRPGEFFGEMAILDNSPRGATCVAKGIVTCLEFNKENFKTIVTGNAQIMMLLLRLFCKRIYDQHRKIKNLIIQDVTARVADVFLMFDETTPADESAMQGTKKRFSLTVNEVAQWAGISNEQARDELNKYVERHKIEIFDGYMIVSNIMDMKRTVDSYYAAHKIGN